MTTTTVPAAGFSLAAAVSFLADFPPAGIDISDGSPQLVLPLIVEATWQPAVAVVAQPDPAHLTMDVHGHAAPRAVVDQVRRILGVDLDHVAFDRMCADDPVLAEARGRHPDLRPVLFGSPFQALAWAILSQRTSMAAASNAAARLTEALGVAVEVRDEEVLVFPTPGQLEEVQTMTGVNEIRAERLRGLAAAVTSGDLTADALLAVDPDEALDRLQQLDGVGRFSAELALVRGAGTPDLFPTREQRLHKIMRDRYQRPDADVTELASIAEAWSPWRSWGAFLLRVDG